jgi:tetratricopeptide (TPR) repeat protein
VIALALALALAAAPPAAAKDPAHAGRKTSPGDAARLADEASRLAREAAALAEAAAKPAPALAEAKLEPDVLGFMSLTQSTAARDGGVKLPWDGPGGTQMKLSWDALDKRNEMLAMGDMMARSLVEAVRQFYETEGGVDPDAMKAKLRNMVAGPMDEARQSYLDAVTWEERRLFFVERALGIAKDDGIPGVDAGLVARRLAAIRSGAMKKAVTAQIDGYRDLALGLIAYLDGDNFGALQKVRGAAEALPEFAVAHAFLGSIYFLFDQKDAAVVSWRRAYQLDPTNQAVAEALKEHGRPKRQSKK